MERSSEPECLLANKVTWTTAWENELALNAKSAFRWRSKVCKAEIVAGLLAATNHECAYCSIWPLRPMEVDHFRPKRNYPQLAYEWLNLYPCCGLCNQNKSDKFDENLLRPDDDGYTFDRYFFFDDLTGSIEPNPAASATERSQARVTIDLLQLNHALNVNQRLEAAGGRKPLTFW
jgi:uncharacterized protein (TIGR02646 family)